MLVEKHGKLIYRELLDTDLDKLQVFCDECKKLNYHNNVDFNAIKLDKMKMPYGKFFIGLDDDKIFTIAGVHQLHEIDELGYRCLFRGAQLPGYTPMSALKFYDIIHFGQLLYLQIQYIRNINKNSNFYITTNIVDNNNGYSSRVNRVFMPRIEKLGIWSLYQSDVVLFNTRQNIYKINVEEYFRQRSLYINSHASSCNPIPG